MFDHIKKAEEASARVAWYLEAFCNQKTHELHGLVVEFIGASGKEIKLSTKALPMLENHTVMANGVIKEKCGEHSQTCH